jgi:hypothetical protein
MWDIIHVSQHCSVDVVFTYVAGSSIFRISMVPAALLACLNFLLYMHLNIHRTSAAVVCQGLVNMVLVSTRALALLMLMWFVRCVVVVCCSWHGCCRVLDTNCTRADDGFEDHRPSGAGHQAAPGEVGLML